MILIIMRHGEAGSFDQPDHARPLTQHGKKQCQVVGKWLQKNLSSWLFFQDQGLHIDLALVSPFLRTQQSYRAVSSGIKIGDQITIDAITPMGNAAQSADLIHGYATDIDAPQSLLVVTHMPLVSLLADKICSEFNAKIFETADTLIIDYNIETGRGEQLAFYQSNGYA